MSNPNLQQAADKEHGSGAPSLLKIVGLVFVVAFVLLLFSFLMELRGNAEESQTLANVIEERESLRAQVVALEAQMASLEGELAETEAAAEADVKALEAKIEALRRQLRPLAAEAEAIVMEKAALLGLTMAEIAEMQGIGLESLEDLDGLYYDSLNLCHYSVHWEDRDLPIEEQRCYRYSQRFSDMFGEDGGTLVGELRLLFDEMDTSSLLETLPVSEGGPYTFMLPPLAGRSTRIIVSTVDKNDYVHPTNGITLAMDLY